MFATDKEVIPVLEKAEEEKPKENAAALKKAEEEKHKREMECKKKKASKNDCCRWYCNCIDSGGYWIHC
ncbi:MAG: hypothetical protein WBIAU1_10310 [Wolbachia endosymbiont of Drosophila biauraria]|nr:MAG: hypothetical protein WBIAU1_10310 [Wolbachia endosymbiont of Drosophila biauraria]